MSTPELSPEELGELLAGLTPEIPDCRVLRLIGRGGMSFVYLGVQESLDRQVAVKVIAPHALRDEVSKARFEKEARTIAKLQHPCIVAIHAVGRSEQGLLFYLMPYFAKGHLGQRDLTDDDAGVIEVVRALLWALDYAHAHGVVHRDVKAENVLFDNADRPLLADFGIAMIKRDRARMTGDGHAVGSAAHMAPEQARAESVDGRADLYSLGVLVFQMVTGRLPFEHADALALAVMHAVDPVPRLTPEKRHWQGFIDQAMAKRPADRFQDAREMMAALERVVDQVRRANERALRGRADDVAPSAARAPQQRPRTLALAIGAALLAVAVAAASLFPPSSTPVITTVESPGVAREPAPSAPLVVPAATLGDDAVGLETASPEEIAPVASVPGEAEVGAALQQIVRRRLTQPAGDNAFDSLLAAHRLAPELAQLPRAGQRWLSVAKPYVASGLAEGGGDAARSLFARANALSDELGLRESEAWKELESVVVESMTSRLRDALARNDLAALRRAKADAEAWGLASARLEPLWSQGVVSARRGDRLRSGETAMVLARLPDAGRPGLAVLPHAVTRQDYSAFVAATGRASARCRIRTARVTLKRRTWERPGFDQAGRHPVVCISAADAAAYAAWLGRRDGHEYRLPQAGEWHKLGLDRATASCGDRCRGTAPIDAGANVGAGLLSHMGSAREWSADCGAGCAERLSVGSSWRDASQRPGSEADVAVGGDEGYDDIGFRLVRDVSAGELAQR